ALGRKLWGLTTSDAVVRTFSFEILLFSALASVFIVRERRRFWCSRPSPFLAGIILADAVAGAAVAKIGIPGVFPPLPLTMTVFLLGYNLAVSLILNDSVKTFLFARTGRD
ncbi:MAG: plasma-membrane proton-efflux P-type ATPase, partial [Acidobacteriota bacterium]